MSGGAAAVFSSSTQRRFSMTAYYILRDTRPLAERQQRLVYEIITIKLRHLGERTPYFTASFAKL